MISATGTLADINPIRYRGYYYDQETGLYHLWSRYYEPQTGRFISADKYTSTGQGMLGYNMFAYCRNNPISRKDAMGTDDISVTDVNNDDDPLNDVGTYYRPGGATATGGNGGSTTGCGNPGGATQVANSGSQNSASARVETNNYAGTSGRTKIHHVVEQCQTNKSGFSKDQIQSLDNKVELDYELHRAISGYYSSKPLGLDGLRV